MSLKCLTYILLINFLLPLTARAEDISAPPMPVDASSADDTVSAIYGEACEKVKNGELISSVRMRATDKASFSAVKSLSDLSAFQSKSNEHDFNVLVYAIVDNFVEDLAVRTTRQNNTEICVEITGYVQKANIATAIEDSVINQGDQKPQNVANLQEDEKSDLEAIEFTSQISPAIIEEEKNPPHPLTPAIAVENSDALKVAQINITDETKNEVPLKNESQRRLIYIAPTEFFDNTTSTAHAAILKKVFDKNDYFFLTDKEELADYIITSKLLRAKVDPINSNTNRLQMVVMVAAKISDDSFSTSEHQNRFILFASNEDEQQVAGKLMQKLFEKAGEKVLDKVENDIRKKDGDKTLPKIITPEH